MNIFLVNITSEEDHQFSLKGVQLFTNIEESYVVIKQHIENQLKKCQPNSVGNINRIKREAIAEIESLINDNCIESAAEKYNLMSTYLLFNFPFEFVSLEKRQFDVGQSKIATKQNKSCEECGGTGVIDKGFYTRKCMECGGV